MKPSAKDSLSDLRTITMDVVSVSGMKTSGRDNRRREEDHDVVPLVVLTS